MRGSLLDELGSDYLTTARAKGLRDVEVRNRHAVPNALLPTTTVVALNFGFVVAGAITIETIFSIPGLGLLTTDALRVPDFWLLQGVFLLSSAGVIVANLAANLLYGLARPAGADMMTPHEATARSRSADPSSAPRPRPAGPPPAARRLGPRVAPVPQQPPGMVGLVVLTLFVLVALLAPLIAPARGSRSPRRPAASSSRRRRSSGSAPTPRAARC